ncbi:flagellar biosynthesis protein FlhB [Marinobacterium sp. D7]|uniref:flagellar biosynthesis protein FlhB n=1 Tax=Marinobacterium ramblicola TaxID=2849041 RepID=UPI001C2CE562|nr:flagellar biosynthesis protein FlhB [Marinobacterium ramblicola]
MADESGQEKTEEPTSKRLQDAREKGDVPRSKELTTTALLMIAGFAALIFGSQIAVDMMSMMKGNFALDRKAISDPSQMIEHLVRSLVDGFLSLWGLFVLLAIVALVSPIALGGWNFSGQALQPKGSRINPLSGLKRMFSLNALVELLKGTAKFLVVGTVAILVLMVDRPEIASLAKQAIEPAIGHAVEIVVWSFLVMSAAMILITLVDVPFQLYSYNKKLKMTLQEVKDEMKNAEGKPEVKGRIRQMQMEMSRRRMMKEVPEADVVITNPTHYSVAIRYDPERGGAPFVVAMGVDFVALRIREIAQEHDVPILASPALARALYYASELGDEVPVGLYKSVAQVLAYVFQLKRYRQRLESEEPVAPEENEIEIPSAFRVDPE